MFFSLKKESIYKQVELICRFVFLSKNDVYELEFATT
jgi:hypothetical protein